MGYPHVTDENYIRFLLIAVSIVQWVLSIRYVRSAQAGSTIFQRRDEGFLLAVGIIVAYLSFVAGVLAYYINPKWMVWSALTISMWVRWLGIFPLLIGAGLLLWGLHHLGANLTISISTKDEHTLVTTGPYRWIRHPLYTGGMIESVGLCLMIGNWFVAISAGCFWALIAYRTPMEEKKLTDVFGEKYRQYTECVGRFVPKLGRRRTH